MTHRLKLAKIIIPRYPDTEDEDHQFKLIGSDGTDLTNKIMVKSVTVLCDPENTEVVLSVCADVEINVDEKNLKIEDI